MNLSAYFPANMRFGQYLAEYQPDRFNGLGTTSFWECPAHCGGQKECCNASHAASTQIQPPAAQGSIGGVLTGIGAILGPIANAFATGYSAKLQMDFQKSQLKQQQAAAAAMPPMPLYMPPPQKSNTAILVVVGVVGLLVVGGVVLLASQNDNDSGKKGN